MSPFSDKAVRSVVASEPRNNTRKLFCNLVVAKSTTRVVVVATHSHGHQIIAIIDPWGHVWPDHSDHEVDAVVWLALDESVV